MRYSNLSGKNRAGRGVPGRDSEITEAGEDYQSNEELPESQGEEEES